jgi:WD40-like Beta Propeller Repeat
MEPSVFELLGQVLRGVTRRFEARLLRTGRQRAADLRREPRRDRDRAGDPRCQGRHLAGVVARRLEDRLRREPGRRAHNIFVLDLATGASTQLTFESALPGGAPSFSPDGSSIVYVAGRWGEGSQLRLHGPYEAWTVPVTGGESVRLMDRPFRGGRLSGQVAWLSPDGSLQSYSCVLGFAALCIANADGTDARVLARGAGISRIDPGGWSPDGTRITYSEFLPQDVFILDVATGQATYVAEGGWPTWLDDHTLIIEIPRCYDPEIGQWNPDLGCAG